MSSNENKGTPPGVPTLYEEPASGLHVPLNMTDIYKFEKMISELVSINSINGPFYMQEFLKAKEMASSYYCRLLYDFEQAKNKTKFEYALAYLERSEAYIEAKKLKPTDETKKQYVALDQGYQKAKDNEDMIRALVTLMGNKVDKFQSAHDDAKKIFDSSRDPRGSLPAMPSTKDTEGNKYE